MEEFIFNDIVRIAGSLGCTRLVGRYRPTPKNKLVADLYARLGLRKVAESSAETVWHLDLDSDYAERRTFITPVEVPGLVTVTS
jgi:predicted enzyme involved in methoxymalonyl-ACP biosynthesis